MLSVFSTLRNALFLWRRHFWTATSIAFVTGVIPVLMAYEFPVHPEKLSPLSELFRIIDLVLFPFFDAANAAAILGVFAKPPNRPVWPALWTSVKNNTLTFYCLFWLIGLVAVVLLIPFSIPFAIFSHFFGPSHFIALSLTGIYLVLIKYALANPIAMVEKRGARDSLKRSWEMTRGCFWYVAGCYLFIGAIEWLILWLLPTPRPSGGFIPFILITFFVRILNVIWFALAWCLYLEIKAKEEGPSRENFPLSSAGG